jgi:hypothetical protein
MRLSEIRKPQVRSLSYQRNSLDFKAQKGYQRRLDRLPSTNPVYDTITSAISQQVNASHSLTSALIAP